MCAIIVYIVYVEMSAGAEELDSGNVHIQYIYLGKGVSGDVCVYQ